MAYDWSGIKFDGSETVTEIVQIVGCDARTVYRKCGLDKSLKYKPVPARERQQHARKVFHYEDEFDGLPRTDLETVMESTRLRPLEGFSSYVQR